MLFVAGFFIIFDVQPLTDKPDDTLNVIKHNILIHGIALYSLFFLICCKEGKP